VPSAKYTKTAKYTVSQYHSITVSQYHSITVSQYSVCQIHQDCQRQLHPLMRRVHQRVRTTCMKRHTCVLLLSTQCISVVLSIPMLKLQHKAVTSCHGHTHRPRCCRGSYAKPQESWPNIANVLHVNCAGDYKVSLSAVAHVSPCSSHQIIRAARRCRGCRARFAPSRYSSRLQPRG
jgi:hypothetical protein